MHKCRASQCWGPDSGAAASSLCGPEARLHEWWLLMSPRSCLATVSINFCLSRSFFRNCANTLFLRLVSFILNGEGKKESKVFEAAMVASVSEPPPGVERVQNTSTVRRVLTCYYSRRCPPGTQRPPHFSHLWRTVKSRPWPIASSSIPTLPTSFPSTPRYASVVGIWHLLQP